MTLSIHAMYGVGWLNGERTKNVMHFGRSLSKCRFFSSFTRKDDWFIPTIRIPFAMNEATNIVVLLLLFTNTIALLEGCFFCNQLLCSFILFILLFWLINCIFWEWAQQIFTNWFPMNMTRTTTHNTLLADSWLFVIQWMKKVLLINWNCWHAERTKM